MGKPNPLNPWFDINAEAVAWLIERDWPRNPLPKNDEHPAEYWPEMKGAKIPEEPNRG